MPSQVMRGSRRNHMRWRREKARVRRAALSNPHYRETIAWMGEKVVPYLDEQGMVPASGRNRETWKNSFLLRE